MGLKSKRRSRPKPDAGNLLQAVTTFEKALHEENCSSLCYFERAPGEVTSIARDGAVHVLRFLKVWFEMPQTVFFSAVGYLDQFLTRIKVQEKYLTCLTVSCFNVAAKRHGHQINASQLVMLSQSKCSVKDMERMSTIITEKLKLENNNDRTALDWLTIFLEILNSVAVKFKAVSLLRRMFKKEKLCSALEILISDSSCACYKPSALTLVYLQYEMERFLNEDILRKQKHLTMKMFYMLAVTIELQNLCMIPAKIYSFCYVAICDVLGEYDTMKKTKHRQKLVWRFSLSTITMPKYSRNFYSILNKVEEEDTYIKN